MTKEQIKTLILLDRKLTILENKVEKLLKNLNKYDKVYNYNSILCLSDKDAEKTKRF